MEVKWALIARDADARVGATHYDILGVTHAAFTPTLNQGVDFNILTLTKCDGADMGEIREIRYQVFDPDGKTLADFRRNVMLSGVAADGLPQTNIIKESVIGFHFERFGPHIVRVTGESGMAFDIDLNVVQRE